MKLAGHTNYKPNVEIVVIPRNEGPDFVFKAKAIMDLEQFDTLCPVPEPPAVIKKGGVKEFDFQNQDYLTALANHAANRMNYMVLESLKATEGLSWDKVVYSDPKTWGLYKEELKEAGFNYTEIQRIENAVYTANCLNEQKVEAARKNFLLSQEATQNASTGRTGTQNSS